jgi:hypothetical protein
VSSMLRTGRVSMVIRRLVHHRSVGREAPKGEPGDPRWVPSSKVDGQVGAGGESTEARDSFDRRAGRR